MCFLATWVAMFTICAAYFTTAMQCWFITDIALLKCFYLVKWSSMSLIDDFFLSTFLKCFHCVYCIIICGIRIHLGELDSNQNLLFLIGVDKQGDDQEFHRVSYFWSVVFPGMVLLILILTATITGLVSKIKHRCRSTIAIEVASPNINNNAYNENIVGVTSAVILSASLLILCIPIFAMRLLNVREPKDVTLFYYFMYVSLCIVLPLIYFLRKPSNFKKALAEIL